MNSSSLDLTIPADARLHIGNHFPALDVDVQILPGRSHWVYVIRANGSALSQLQQFLEERLARSIPTSGQCFVVYGDEIHRLTEDKKGRQFADSHCHTACMPGILE